MKKRILIIVSSIVLLLVLLLFFIFSNNISKKREEKLYSIIEQVITSRTYNIDKIFQNNFNTFFSIKRLGSKTEGDITYIYCWIQTESFYINQDGRVELYQGDSMPYRFTFEGDELLKYEFPRSGEMEYADSIKELFPFWVRVKFNTIYNDNELKNDILEQVENYYNITVDKIYY
mgnify:FL=1